MSFASTTTTTTTITLTAVTITTSTTTPDTQTAKRSSPQRRLVAAVSTAKLFHLFVLLNGCGFVLFWFQWSSHHPTTHISGQHWRDNGRRGTLEIPSNNHNDNNDNNEMTSTSLKRNQTPQQQQQHPQMDQHMNIIVESLINLTTMSATTTASDASAATVNAAPPSQRQQPLAEALFPSTDATTTADATTNTTLPQLHLSPASSGRLETIRRLAALGINISEYIELLPFLPPWSSVMAQYGDGPRIHGLDTCAAYRKAIPIDERTMASTGLFNSGTNLLAFLMEDNCEISPGLQKYGGCRLPQRGISWQPPWGKHNPIAARFSDYSINKTIYLNNPHHVVLPVVTVRHPFDWMNSSCRHRYALRFVRWDREDGKECPFIVAKPPDTRTVPVYVDYAFPGRVYYKSLAHLWNRWNRPYFDKVYRVNATTTVEAPKLMVRHEDLIFYPDQVVQKVCQCIGGKYLFHGRGFQLTEASAKWGPGHGATKTGFVDAWIKYGHERTYDHFDPLDKAKAIEYFDKQMLRTFRYKV